MSEPDGIAFAQALRHALTERDLTLDRVQARLAERGISVGRSTLSFWQNGHRTPRGAASLRAVAALEEVLEVSPGLLTDTLGRPPSQLPVVMSEDSEPMQTVLQAINGERLMDNVRMRQAITRLWVTEQGCIERVETQLVLRVVHPTNRFAFVAVGEPGADARLVSPSVEGGRIGRVAAHAEMLGVEILLEQDHRRGDLFLLRYAVQDANRVPATQFVKFSVGGASLNGLIVSFNEQRLPVQVEHFQRAEATGSDLMVVPLSLNAGHRVSVLRERDRRGMMGVRWRFADGDDGSQRDGSQRGGIE